MDSRQDRIQKNYDLQDLNHAEDLVRSRQRFQRRAKKASEVLNHLLARTGYAQQESSNQLAQTWVKIVGKPWQFKTRIGNVRRGILEVTVSNSAVSQHLGFEKKKILSQLQQELPQNKIHDLRFRIGPID